jgi:hypothetical protein
MQQWHSFGFVYEFTASFVPFENGTSTFVATANLVSWSKRRVGILGQRPNPRMHRAGLLRLVLKRLVTNNM